MRSHFSRVQLFATPWTAARQVPLSMGFSRQEYLSRLPCRPPGDLPDPGIEPVSPALQVDSLPLSHQGSPNKYAIFISNGICVPNRNWQVSMPIWGTGYPDFIWLVRLGSRKEEQETSEVLMSVFRFPVSNCKEYQLVLSLEVSPPWVSVKQ